MSYSLERTSPKDSNCHSICSINNSLIFFLNWQLKLSHKLCDIIRSFFRNFCPIFDVLAGNWLKNSLKLLFYLIIWLFPEGQNDGDYHQKATEQDKEICETLYCKICHFCRLFANFYQLLSTLFFISYFWTPKSCVFVIFVFFSFSIFSLILLFLEVSTGDVVNEGPSEIGHLSHSGR